MNLAGAMNLAGMMQAMMQAIQSNWLPWLEVWQDALESLRLRWV